MVELADCALMDDDPYINDRDANRVRWRCRRGLLENDLIIERYLERHSGYFRRSEADALMQLMNLSDAELLDLLLRRSEPEGALNTPTVRKVLAEMRPTFQ